MKPGELTHIVGPVWLVTGQNKGRFPFSHSFLIKDKTTALIDTGAGPLALEPLAKKKNIDLVLITHTHPDHMALSCLFKGAEILVPEMALKSADSAYNLSRRFFSDPKIAAIWRDFVVASMGFVDFPPTGFFKSNQTIQIGNTLLQVIHTPGHTKDHCCFYLPQWDLLFSSDIDLTGFGPWYANPECDMAMFRDSIELVAKMNPKYMISSHKGVFTKNIPRLLQKYASIMDQRENRLLGILKEEKTIDQLVDMATIYGSFPHMPELLRYWEKVMVSKHLDELLLKGAIQRKGALYVAVK